MSLMVDDAKVRWLRSPRLTHAICPLCSNRARNRIILTARHWNEARGDLELVSCGDCGSAFFPDVAAHEDYPSNNDSLDNPEFRLLLCHYVELVSGVEWKIPLLERLPFGGFQRVLEIGCNMGIALDYCRTVWGIDALGLEPSSYGVGGRTLLNIPISKRYLADDPEASRGGFDLIYATEVLEHIPEPRGFLQEVRQRLSPSGIVLFTTPMAENVTPTSAPGDLYATLSAGAHYWIPSRRALGALLRDCGFGPQKSLVTGNSQVIYAGRASFALSAAPPLEQRRHYYYKRRVRDIDDGRLRLAYLIHAYDSAIRAGIAGAFGSFGERALDDLEELFCIDIRAPGELQNALAGASNIFDFGRLVPYGLPLLLRSLAADPESPIHPGHAQALCALICAHGLRVDFQNLFAYHALYRVARAESLRLAAGAGEVASLLLEDTTRAAAAVPELTNPEAELPPPRPTLLGRLREIFAKAMAP